MKWYLFIWFLFSWFLVNGQPIKQYYFSHYTVSDGLASNYVTEVVQDEDKFMWIATLNGLQRFDGKKFQTFILDSAKNKYDTDVVNALLFNEREELLVGGNNLLGIFNTRKRSFKKIEINGINENFNCNSLIKTEEGIFLSLLDLNLIYHFDPLIKRFVKYLEIADNYKIKKLKWDRNQKLLLIITNSNTLFYNVIEKRFYSNLKNQGLSKISKIEFIQDIENLKQNYTVGVNWSTKEVCPSIFSFNKEKDSFFTFNLLSKIGNYHEFVGIYQQRNGSIWIYGSMLLGWFSPNSKGVVRIRDENVDGSKIYYNRIFSIYEDKDNNLWLSTDNGILIFNPEKEVFQTHYLSSSQTVNSESKKQLQLKTDTRIPVHTAFEFSNKNILVCSWGYGVFMYDSTFSPLPLPRQFKAISSNPVWDICRQRGSSKIWMTLQNGGIFIYDEKTNTGQKIFPDIFKGRTILQIEADNQGNFLLGTQDGRIIKWINNSSPYSYNFKFIELFKTHGPIQRITKDKEGNIWFGTSELFKLNTVSGKINKILNSDRQKAWVGYNDIIQYNDSLLLVAAGYLYIVNTKRNNFEQIYSLNNIAINTVTSLVLDNDKTLWAGMFEGLARINLTKGFLTNYNSKNGIAYDKFNNALKLSDGRILFFTDLNFLVINPKNFIQKNPPKLKITDIKISGKSISSDSVMKRHLLELMMDKSTIEISFGDFNYTKQWKYHYYYKLEGYDKDWVNAEDKTAFYSNLPAGVYNFKIKCVNIDGVSSELVSPLSIDIHLPFWRKPWFYFIVFFVLIFVVYLFYKNRYEQLLLLEKMRSKIARDLHDDIGSTLSTITILSEIALKPNGYEGKDAYLAKINNYSSQLMSSMNDIVWSINPMNDSMQKITARMREYLANTLERKNIDYSFSISDDVYDLHLDMESRRNFYLIFKETINNIAKYASCSKVSILICIEHARLIMMIKDNGVGFNISDAKNRGNGLINLESRANAIGGAIEIKSEIGKGTVTLLEIPL